MGSSSKQCCENLIARASSWSRFASSLLSFEEPVAVRFVAHRTIFSRVKPRSPIVGMVDSKTDPRFVSNYRGLSGGSVYRGGLRIASFSAYRRWSLSQSWHRRPLRS